MGRMELPNGMVIDAENPTMHEAPTVCPKCGVSWYFGGHYCVAENESPEEKLKKLKEQTGFDFE